MSELASLVGIGQIWGTTSGLPDAMHYKNPEPIWCFANHINEYIGIKYWLLMPNIHVTKLVLHATAGFEQGTFHASVVKVLATNGEASCATSLGFGFGW